MNAGTSVSSGTGLFEKFGDQECQFHCLRGIQAGVAMGKVLFGQFFFGNALRAPNTLRYVLSRHLTMNTSGVGPFRIMDLKKVSDLT